MRQDGLDCSSWCLFQYVVVLSILEWGLARSRQDGLDSCCCWFQSFVVLAASFSPFVPFDSGAAFFDGVFPLLPLCCVGLPYLIVSGCVQLLLHSVVMWGFDFVFVWPDDMLVRRTDVGGGDFEFLNPMPTRNTVHYAIRTKHR